MRWGRSARCWVALVRLSGVLVIVLAASAAVGQRAASGEPRKVITNSVIPLPEGATAAPRGLIVNSAEPDRGREKMDVLFSFGLPKGQASSKRRS